MHAPDKTLTTDARRYAALDALGVLDTPAEPEFDDLARLAAVLCGTPIALVSLVDRRRQWFKARVGVDATETPVEMAFCAHALRQPELFEVPDAAEDDRFRDNPLVTGPPHIRFYAGAPVTAPDGCPLGTLCVIDRVPRALTADQRDALRILAAQVSARLRMRAQVAELARTEAALRAEAERFRAFMDNSPAMAFMKDADGRFVYVNGPVSRKFGIPEAAWLGKTDADLFPPDIAAALRATDLAVLAGGETVAVLETVPTADGTADTWQSYKFPFTDADGRRMLAGMAVDVTAERAALAALTESEERFRRVVEQLAEGVVLLDHGTRRVIRANRAFRDLLGYTADELAALTQYDFVAHDRADVDARMAVVAAKGRDALGLRAYRHKSGELLDVSVSGSHFTLGGRPVLCLVVRDTGEQARYERQLVGYQLELEAANAKLLSQSTTDALTGVGNRAAFNDALNAAHERATRTDRPLSVLLLDVDHFKAFNDTFGHPAGDAVLATVGRALKETVRGLDVVARYGGEEFAVVLPDTDHAGAMVLAERCRRAIAGQPWPQRAVTVSVGVATRTEATADRFALVAAADAALYQSKRAGRNRVHFSGAIPARAAREPVTPGTW